MDWISFIWNHKYKWAILLIIFLLAVIFSRTDSVRSILKALSPPDIPELLVKDKNGDWLPQVWLNQNWGNKKDNPSLNTQKYHHISQGTRTLPLPYDWFVNIEQPASSLFAMPFSSKPKFIDSDYLLRFGFIRSQANPEINPDGLPIGFARTASQNVKGFNTQTETIGFTCAACHTSHFIFEGTNNNKYEYIVEGGPAMTDLGLLGSALQAAIGQLVISAKVGLVGGRFDRFAKNVLGAEYNANTKVQLKSDLVSFAEAQLGAADIIQVTEGFTRLDALNRIGNAVFSANIDRPQNMAPIDAPVNYPHIWTASWFNWVQYDASVMGPLIRNVGEALGVKAFSDVKSPPDDHRFSSSIPVINMVWLEQFLSGDEPTPETGFNGLLAPKWDLTEIDNSLAAEGNIVYQTRCEGCHLPVLTSEKIWNTQYLAPIEWYKGDEKHQTEEKVLKLKVIPTQQLGTDTNQANVMVSRTMDTSGNDTGTLTDRTKGMMLDKTICVRDTNVVAKQQLSWTSNDSSPTEYWDIPLVEMHISDAANVSFGYALAATVEQTIDAWFDLNGLTDKTLQQQFLEGRPNCIQAGMGYKARPLNGVWATAPFLHNGSVPTLRDLLCPINNTRPEYIQLGSPEFDVENIGILQPRNFLKTAESLVKKRKLYDKQGYFILNTKIQGNRNTGHEFSDRYDQSKPYWQQDEGVLGPKLTPRECDAILEYLKTI